MASAESRVSGLLLLWPELELSQVGSASDLTTSGAWGEARAGHLHVFSPALPGSVSSTYNQVVLVFTKPIDPRFRGLTMWRTVH